MSCGGRAALEAEASASGGGRVVPLVVVVPVLMFVGSEAVALAAGALFGDG